MYIRKCPKCEDGKMKAIESFRGWGIEYKYSCDSCGHEKWIYEGHPNNTQSYENSNTGFWLLLIVFELFIFLEDSVITSVDYILYIGFLLLFLYKALVPKKLSSKSKNRFDYKIIGEIDELTPQEIEEKKLLEKADKMGIRYWIYPITLVSSILATLIFENPYFLIITILSFLYAYKAGILDISKQKNNNI